MSGTPYVILINPPFGFSSNPELTVSYPLGLMYIASLLEKKGVKVKIIDFINNRDTRFIENTIKNNKADIFGISVLTSNRYEAFKIVKIIRKLHKQSKVVLGGTHATLLYQQILENTDIDAIFLGESELSFLEYSMAFGQNGDVSHIPGIAFKKASGEIIANPIKWVEDIDTIPLPAFHLVDLDNYKNKRNEIDFHMLTSRGCPFFCNFCSLPAIHNGRYRLHSVARVLEELELVSGFKKNCRVMLHDDFLSAADKRMRELCEGIIKKGIKLKWSIRSRVDTVDLDTLKLMRSSGCEEIFYGIESGSRAILQSMNKRFNIEDAKNAFSLTKKSGIKAICYIIVGYPGENHGTVKDTQKLLFSLAPDKIYFSLAGIFPGTTLYQQSIKDGVIKDSYWLKNGNRVPLYTKDMSCINMLMYVYIIRLSLERGLIRKIIFLLRSIPRELSFEYNVLKSLLLDKTN
ncbi:MAG: radical SAM protein [Candidatus Omnitrophica bacterium]|jgi:radical SAM superfamily enzyme YgiQ (UPF0313 family)|nr:radical SAM protein [Candidatus Omnitrophota bacterium]MDD5518174.1 radical SAM protein [Candidatus Omnitrophota bacterium]